MRSIRLLFASCILLASIAALTPGSAAIVVYTDPVAFFAALSGSYTENFDGFSEGVAASPQSFSQNSYSYTLDVFDQYGDLKTGNTLIVAPSVGITTGHTLGVLSSYNTLGFTFAGDNVNAFGGYFWGSDYMHGIDTFGALTFYLYESGSFSPELVYELPNTTGPTFVGFISDGSSFTWVDVTGYPTFTYATMANVTVGSTVPEPSTSALLGAIAGLGLLRRRVRRA
jgi:hypothetical protein